MTVVVRLRYSKLWRLLQVSVHLLALVGIWLASLATPLQMALSLAVAVSLGATITRLRVMSIVCHAGEWYVRLTNGERRAVALRPEMTVLPFLVMLSFKDRSGAILHVPVLQDSTDSQTFRRLRVFLRFAQPKLGGTRTVSEATVS